MPIQVQTDDFDLGAEISKYSASRPQLGAIVNFVGYVRDDQAISGEIPEQIASASSKQYSLRLEHYPQMTERALEEIAQAACTRWTDIYPPLIIHRIGELFVGEQIVLVLVGSRHRRSAFAAAEFIMDYLKTSAPFWKYENSPSGGKWVDARDSDIEAAERWGI